MRRQTYIDASCGAEVIVGGGGLGGAGARVRTILAYWCGTLVGGRMCDEDVPCHFSSVVTMLGYLSIYIVQTLF